MRAFMGITACPSETGGLHRLLGNLASVLGKYILSRIVIYFCWASSLWSRTSFLWFRICFCSAKVHLRICFPLQQQVALSSSRYSHTHNHFVLHVLKTSLPRERTLKRNLASFYRCSRLSAWKKTGVRSFQIYSHWEIRLLIMYGRSSKNRCDTIVS